VGTSRFGAKPWNPVPSYATTSRTRAVDGSAAFDRAAAGLWRLEQAYMSSMRAIGRVVALRGPSFRMRV
jgi:hypothetical protein